jgi:hypothetical protein
MHLLLISVFFVVQRRSRLLVLDVAKSTPPISA